MSLAIAVYTNILVYFMVRSWLDLLDDVAKDFKAWRKEQWVP